MQKYLKASRRTIFDAGQSPLALEVKKEKVLDRQRRSIEIAEREAAYGAILTQKFETMQDMVRSQNILKTNASMERSIKQKRAKMRDLKNKFKS